MHTWRRTQYSVDPAAPLPARMFVQYSIGPNRRAAE